MPAEAGSNLETGCTICVYVVYAIDRVDNRYTADSYLITFSLALWKKLQKRRVAWMDRCQRPLLWSPGEQRANFDPGQVFGVGSRVRFDKFHFNKIDK